MPEQEKMENLEKKHISVLLNELVDSIDINKNKVNIVVDCTLGMWWHASEIIRKMNPWDILIWFDADIQNLELAKERLSRALWENNTKFWFIESIGNKAETQVNIALIHSNFVHLKKVLHNIWIEKVTWIYYDLWISSLHVDEAERWFSFKKDGPLDMRFDKSAWRTAADIINSYTASELRNIFLTYWEEPSSNKLAHMIVERRKKKKFKTTWDLSEVISEVSKNQKSKNRIFQALRIETNKELENIEISLKDAIELLEEKGKIFVISFHSLDDRITKQIFRKETKDCICNDLICSCRHKKSLKVLSKKPILPTKEEIEKNPRSRSAKARLAEKIL